jgi:transcriptional regulator with XRE-family HTH domain
VKTADDRFGQPRKAGTLALFALKQVSNAPGADEARRRWTAGQVVPHRITLALDSCRLDGPEVDEACGVQEPAVDRWERGTLYPTWDQLCALALLTDFPVAFFAEPADENPIETNVHFRPIEGKPVYERQPRPVLAFTEKAILRTLGSRYVCPTCHRPR